MRHTFILLLLLCISCAYSQPQAINNFTVKEHLLKNSKIAIIATDSLNKPIETVNGTFAFTINGFKQDLKFNDGIAVAPQQIEKSAFVYLKHENISGTHAKLYYILKKADDLNPIKINWMLLLIIPFAILGIAALFRKFLIIGILLLIGIFFFNSSKGLALPTFFDTIIQGLKNLF